MNALTSSDRSSGLAERARTFSAIAVLYGNREIDDTSTRYNHLRPITNSTVQHVCHETNLELHCDHYDYNLKLMYVFEVNFVK